jgi:hypothetical protein
VDIDRHEFFIKSGADGLLTLSYLRPLAETSAHLLTVAIIFMRALNGGRGEGGKVPFTIKQLFWPFADCTEACGITKLTCIRKEAIRDVPQSSYSLFLAELYRLQISAAREQQMPGLITRRDHVS